MWRRDLSGNRRSLKQKGTRESIQCIPRVWTTRYEREGLVLIFCWMYPMLLRQRDFQAMPIKERLGWSKMTWMMSKNLKRMRRVKRGKKSGYSEHLFLETYFTFSFG